MTTPFAEFKTVLENMTMEHKLALIKNYKDFGRLKELCRAKGYIEVLPRLVGIRVIKNKPEVKQLKKVVDQLKIGNFKWLAKGQKDTH